MKIEKLKLEDILGVVELHKELVPFDILEKDAIEVYKKMLENEDYYLVVAKEGNSVLGCAMGVCCYCLSGPFLVIEDVIVKDGLRGKGVGKKLMNALDDFAKEKKCDYAILVSSAFRENAHKFYEAMGFADSVRGFRKIYYKESQTERPN